MSYFLTPAEAWADFWEHVRPVIWENLTPSERQALQQARRAAEGKIVRKGRVVQLGHRRLQYFLQRYAPERYTFEMYIRVNPEHLK